MQLSSHSDGVTARGRNEPDVPHRLRHGINNYIDWFAGDDSMRGNYFGYDGLCPPWNDSIVHNHRFTRYALDIARCPVTEPFTGADVRAVIAGHIRAEASLAGRYSLNPDVPA